MSSRAAEMQPVSSFLRANPPERQTPRRMHPKSSLGSQATTISPPQFCEDGIVEDDVLDLAGSILTMEGSRNDDKDIIARKLLLAIESPANCDKLASAGSVVPRLAQLLVSDYDVNIVLAQIFAKLTINQAAFTDFPEIITIVACGAWKNLKTNQGLVAYLLICLLNLTHGQELECERLVRCPLSIPMMCGALTSNQEQLVLLASKLVLNLTRDHLSPALYDNNRPSWNDLRCCLLRIPSIINILLDLLSYRSQHIRRIALDSLISLVLSAGCDPDLPSLERDLWIGCADRLEAIGGTINSKREYVFGQVLDILRNKAMSGNNNINNNENKRDQTAGDSTDTLSRSSPSSRDYSAIESHIVGEMAEQWMLQQRKEALTLHVENTHDTLKTLEACEDVCQQVDILTAEVDELQLKKIGTDHHPMIPSGGSTVVPLSSLKQHPTLFFNTATTTPPRLNDEPQTPPSLQDNDQQEGPAARQKTTPVTTGHFEVLSRPVRKHKKDESSKQKKKVSPLTPPRPPSASFKMRLSQVKRMILPDSTPSKPPQQSHSSGGHNNDERGGYKEFNLQRSGAGDWECTPASNGTTRR